jgi:hypothetical protein
MAEADPNPVPRRGRRWPLVLLIALGIAVAGWVALWNYGAGEAERTIEAWKAREAQAGRIYTCATQDISGFPFRIEIRCAEPSAELKSNQPPLSVKAKDVLVTASVWQPTVLTAEFAGPLLVTEPGQAPLVTANWRQARTQLHGLPPAPDSASISLDQPKVDGGGENLFQADHLDLNGRILSGTVRSNPVVEIVLKLAAGAAPAWHPAAAIPVDADITAVLRGLKDFSPKPWRERLRELQAAGGSLEIVKARVQQRETIAVANGTLGLSPAGRLNGQLQLTVANLERLLPLLGLDKLLAQDQAPRQLENAFSALDRLMPGLGNVARQNAGPAIVAGISVMGRPTELEGQRAVELPLRFDDGLVTLGPLTIGMTPPLF